MRNETNNTATNAKDATMKTLADLHRHATQYEIAVRNGPAEVRLVGYTGRKSGGGLVALAQLHGDAIVSFLGMTDTTPSKFTKGRKALVFGGLGTVYFTGRTRRDAIQLGELTELAD